MNPADLVRSAARGVRGNITRSVLTMLMVVIGVGSVITLVAIGNGTTKQVNDQVASLGITAIEVYAGYSDERGDASFSLDDVDALSRSRLGPDIGLVAPLAMTTAKSAAGPNEAEFTVYGTTPEIFEIKNSRLLEGRLLKAADERGDGKLAVIDEAAADALFPGRSAVGQTVIAGSTPFEVVGVLATSAAERKLGVAAGGTLYAPVHRVQASLTGYGPLSSVLMSATTADRVEAAKAQATAILAARASDPLTAPPPSFSSSDDLREALGGANDSLGNMLSGVAAISLLVGGIGVTNVMLLTVRERTREIGIRKALGAGRGTVAAQFLLEATALCVVGGTFGVLVAFVITRWPINDVPPIVDLPTVLLAAGISILLGVGSGTYPALRAAGMDPIAALRVGS